MTPRTLLVGILALSLAAGTAFFVQGWLTQQRNALYASLPKAVAKTDAPKVLVARKALPAGMILTASHLEWKEWPEDGVSDSFIVQGQGKVTDKALHGAVLRRIIGTGEPVTEDRVVKAGERGFLAAVLTQGMRAVSVPVTATSGISGFVFPGDRIDLILAHKVQSGEGQERKINRASETILTDVRVLAVDQKTATQEGAAVLAKTATLEVTPTQAEIIAVSVTLGELSLSLRSLRREHLLTGNAEEDHDRPAIRGKTITRDRDVSQLIRRLGGTPQERVVNVVRGSEAEVLKLKGIN
jgi:pilus assembly protein CpaB